MSQHSPSREAFLNIEHAKLTGNIKIPDVSINRDNAHRKSWELRQVSSINTEASPPLIGTSSDSYEPSRFGCQG
jgi:hypothetical protein